MAETKDLSVLIPVYNAAPWLDACLQSVQAQTVQPREVILVNDGSADESAALCEAWAERWPAVKVIHQPNKGVSAARNAALEAATGRWLMPLDADDWLEPSCIETLLTLLIRERTPMAACNHWIEYQHSRKPCFDTAKLTNVMTAEQALDSLLYHRVPDVSCWGKLYCREVFKELRYPEGRLYEDTWLIAPVLMAAGSMAYTSVPLYHYRIRPDSISRAAWGREKLDLLEAVKHLTELVRAAYPQLEAGCIRREAHAAMSVRRYFVDCSDPLKPQRDELEQLALRCMPQVMRDPRAPLRDKLALTALRCGPWAYDLLWKLQRKA